MYKISVKKKKTVLINLINKSKSLEKKNYIKRLTNLNNDLNQNHLDHFNETGIDNSQNSTFPHFPPRTGLPIIRKNPPNQQIDGAIEHECFQKPRGSAASSPKPQPLGEGGSDTEAR